MFSCDICGKTFTEKTNLIRHAKIHGDRPVFSCNVCSKQFTRADDLTQHQKVHEEEQPVFRCDICWKEFTEKRNLTRHQKTTHGDQPLQKRKASPQPGPPTKRPRLQSPPHLHSHRVFQNEDARRLLCRRKDRQSCPRIPRPDYCI